MVRKAAGVLAFCFLTNALLAQPRPPGFRPHYKAFCVVDGQGRARCVRFEDLNRLLSPGQIQKLQNLVDELFPQLSTRTGAARNTIADCSGDRWVRADLSIPPSAPAGPITGVPGSTRKRAPFPSSADAEQLLAQCRSAVQTDLDHAVAAVGGVGGSDRLVADTVAKMDAAVANCRESSMGAVALQGGASQWADAQARYRDAVQAVETKYSPDDVAKHDPAATNAYATLADAKETETFLHDIFAAAQTKTDKGDREETFKFLVDLLNTVSAELERAAKASPPPPPSGPTNSEPSGQRPAPVTTPASGAAMPCQGENCKPSCADVAAAWSRFKAYCEESHWKVYKCMSFLAKVNGCADPSLIHPSPEGDDMTCPDKARVDKWSKAKVAWLEQCRKRQWVMMPTQDGKLVCVAPDFQGMDQPRFDPCNNPRAMPGPDDCGGPVPPIEPSRPVPKPDPR